MGEEREVGKWGLKVYVMCDGYVGVDQEYGFSVDVCEGSIGSVTGTLK
jgi:hypothetical protein